jgi:protein O-GlcNAc transferase
VHINLGLALEQQDPEAAARAYRRALELNPYEAVAYFNLANVYLRGGRLAEAIPLYERAAALDPSLANAHFYLARALAAQGAWDRALRALDDGLRFAPADADALQLREEIVRLRR